VAGVTVRPDRILPTAEDDEGVQVDNAASSGMSKITYNFNLLLIDAGPQS
jgi:hypothetical protein